MRTRQPAQAHSCGGSLNQTNVCDEAIDTLLNKAREVSEPGARAELYRQAIEKMAARRNIVYLYHLNYIVAHPRTLQGYRAVPDGLIRLKGVRWKD